MNGTYTGLVEKVPYLKDLGITAVELMPVFQFDETEVHMPSLKNYWGYSPLAFFAPHSSYCYCNEPHVIADEFRDMVKAFHKAGIEVICSNTISNKVRGYAKMAVKTYIPKKHTPQTIITYSAYVLRPVSTSIYDVPHNVYHSVPGFGIVQVFIIALLLFLHCCSFVQ